MDFILPLKGANNGPLHVVLCLRSSASATSLHAHNSLILRAWTIDRRWSNGYNGITMPEPKHNLHSTSSVQQSFNDGARSGEQFGTYAAPFIVGAFILFWGWVAYRIVRWFFRATR